MTRPAWRQLARTLLRLANTRTSGRTPDRIQADLWTAVDHRIAAQNGRTRWL